MTDGYFSYPLEALKKPLTSPKELEDIRPLGKDLDWYRFQIGYAKKLTALYGKEVPLFYNLFAVPRTIEFMQASLGHPVDIASWIQEYPEETAHVFDVISKDYADLARGLIEEGGVDGIYLSVNNVSYDRLTEDAYKNMWLPMKSAFWRQPMQQRAAISFTSAGTTVSTITWNGTRIIPPRQ